MNGRIYRFMYDELYSYDINYTDKKMIWDYSDIIRNFYYPKIIMQENHIIVIIENSAKEKITYIVDFDGTVTKQE